MNTLFAAKELAAIAQTGAHFATGQYDQERYRRIGELAAALRDHSPKDEVAAEFADVIAWLTTIANVAGIDLDQALRKKYGAGCPGCGQLECRCSPAEKP